MKRLIPLLALVLGVGAAGVSSGQRFTPQISLFDRETYIRETDPESLTVYHWAVWRQCIHPKDRNYVGREAVRAVYGYVTAERHSQYRMMGSMRVNEFRRRPSGYGGITHGTIRVHENVNVGPLWVTKRAVDYQFVAPYDFIRENSEEIITSVSEFAWAADDLPPPLDAYWPDATRPDWFNEKLYRLFVPQEKTAWWCRSEAGPWDLIDEGELVEENGAGPGLLGPKVKFEGQY